MFIVLSVLVVVPGLFRELCFVFFVLLSRGCGFVGLFCEVLGSLLFCACFVLVVIFRGIVLFWLDYCALSCLFVVFVLRCVALLNWGC